MKRTVLFASGIALSGLMMAAGAVMQPVHADGNTAATTQPPFLFLNVQKVFADYKKFQVLSENLKTQLETKEKQLMEAEGHIKAKVDSIQQMQNQEDRDNLQKEVQTLKFDYEKTRRDARQEFLTTEADMYATCYSEMYQLVDAYCTKHGYYCVFKIQEADTKDRSSPNKILAVLNREVVFNHAALDVTQIISTGLNQQWEQAQAARPGGANPVR